MRDRNIRSAPNYTVPALVMLGVNLTWVLIAIWAMWGYAAALVTAAGVNHAISRFASRQDGRPHS